MADSDVEINVDDVCGAEHGVEVETILQGQTPLATPAHELDFMVQEEVETTTDGDTLPVELDPVDNVIIALHENEELGGGGHFGLKNGDLELDEPFNECLQDSLSSSALILGKRRRRGHSSRGSKSYGSSPGKKAKPKKSKKGNIRFSDRQVPTGLSGGVAKEPREANDINFDPEKIPRKWRKRKLPIRTVDGGSFAVSMWCPGTLFKPFPPSASRSANYSFSISPMQTRRRNYRVNRMISSSTREARRYRLKAFLVTTSPILNRSWSSLGKKTKLST